MGEITSASRSFFEEGLAQRIRHWQKHIPPELREKFLEDMYGWPVWQYTQAVETFERHLEETQRTNGLDDLTKIARRRLVNEHLLHILSDKSGVKLSVGIIFVDLNDFKLINDEISHKAGDQALTAAAEIIQEAIRSKREIDFVDRMPMLDPEQGNRAGRWGGDEFLVVLKLKDPVDIEQIASRIKSTVDNPDKQVEKGYLGGRPFTVAVGGVSYCLGQELQSMIAINTLAEALTDKADKLMYCSKTDGQVHIGYACLEANMDSDPPKVDVVLGNQVLL